jgi:hypothetical protein
MRPFAIAHVVVWLLVQSAQSSPYICCAGLYDPPPELHIQECWKGASVQCVSLWQYLARYTTLKTILVQYSH